MTRESHVLVALSAGSLAFACGLYVSSRRRQQRSLESRSPWQPRWEPLEYSVLFGIVGGLGPKAMTYFVDGLISERCRLFEAMSSADSPEARLKETLKVSTASWTSEDVEQVFRQTRGRTQLLDQDHVPLLAAQATTVPPRPKYILGESRQDPLPQLVSVAQGLVSAGATHLAIICNTAHHFWPSVQGFIPDARCLDMVEMTLSVVARMAKSCEDIGVFATTATIRTSMYRTLAKNKFGLKVISPLDLEDKGASQATIEQVIFGTKGIKSGYDNPDRNIESRASLRIIIQQALVLHRSFGVDVIILACSELPLIINDESIQRWARELSLPASDIDDLVRLKFVDPGRILAHEILRLTLLSRN